MTDCRNAEVRDLLPDLVHERLDAARRRELEAHVSGCAACAAEAALLTAMRAALGRTAPVDARRVAEAVGRAMARTPTPAGAPRARARISGMEWNARRLRVAAVIATIALGGPALVLAARELGWGPGRQSLPESVAGAAGGEESEAARAARAVAPDGAPGGPSGRAVSSGDARDSGLPLAAMAELADDDIRALLADLEKLDGVPAVEPVPVVPLIEGTS